MKYIFVLTPLGVPIGTSNHLHDTSDFIAAAGMLNQSIGNAIQAGQNKEGRRQAARFFEDSIKEQWKAIKEQEWYNSYANKRQMLNDAGYSPYALFNTQNSGVSQSISPNGTPQLNSSPFDSSAFSSAAQQLTANKLAQSQQKNLDANTAQVNIDNFTRDAKNLADIRESLSKAGVNNAEQIGKNLANYRARMTMDSMIAYDNRQIDLINSQIAEKLSNAAYIHSLQLKTDKETEWVDKFGRQNIAESLSRMAVNAAQANVAYTQAKLYSQNLLESIARTNGINISNNQAKRVNDLIFSQEFYKAAQEETKARYLYDYGTVQPEEVRKDKFGFTFHRKVDHSRDTDLFDANGRRKPAKF